MTDARKDIPGVSAPNYAERVRETLSTYLGLRGDKLDRGLTVRDLFETGFIELNKTFLQTGRGSPVGGVGATVTGAVVYEPDLMPPPTPTGFVASAGISSLFFGHDIPLYKQGHGHGRTVVYGATYTTGPLPTFSNAVPITEFLGTVGSYTTNPATVWHLWIKWRSIDGVLSTSPAGGTNGLVVTTGQNVSTLLQALTGQITAAELNTTLGTRINLIDGNGAGSVNERIASEATTRALAITAEQTARSAAVTAEAVARSDADIAEVTARAAAISSEAASRISGLSAEASTRAAALLSEANARQAQIATVTTAYQAADTSFSSQLTTLTAGLSDAVAANSSEAATRASADAAEATQRTTLAAQMRGTYNGTDPSVLTEGLIYQTNSASVTRDNALSQSITLLSAGAGEQFDYSTIWYFDATVEGWTGNGSPTVASGFLRPANSSDAYIISPAALAIDASKYGQLRLRIRKVGAPTWGGKLYWNAPADSVFSESRKLVLTEPTYDSNGIGLVTGSPSWSGTVGQIRLHLSAVQGAADYFEFDWIAVGRPSPGASSAELALEKTTRASADLAESTARQTLSSTLIGVADPSGVSLGSLTAGIIYDEKTTRSSADSSLSSSISILSSTVTNNHTTTNAAILSEQTTRATADSALGTRVDGVIATATTDRSTAAAAIVAEQTSRADADTAEASARTTLASRVTTAEGSITANSAAISTNSAAITSEQTTRASADSALGTRVDTVVATANTDRSNASAAITSEANSRAAADNAEAAARTTLAARVTTAEGAITSNSTQITTNAAAITTEQVARASADGALGTRIDTVVATATTDRNSSAAAIATEQTARADADTAEASARTTLASRVTTAEGAITGNTNAISTNAAAIVTEANTRASADTAEASARTTLAARVTTAEGGISTNAAAIVTEQNARAAGDAAEVSERTTLAARVTTSENAIANNAATSAAAIVTEQTARATADSAISASVSTLSATVTTNNTTLSAAIATEQSVRAGADGALFAQYTVKLDANGYVSGFGLASTANNAIPQSTFGVRADSFYIASPAGPGVAPAMPFIVRTTPITINGVSVPAGVYMTDAFIQNGTITNAKIGNAAIDDAKVASLSASKLTAGSIAVGEYIQGTGYVAGSAGWRINGNGTAEFSGVTVRGTVIATAGSIGGNTINSSGIYSPNYASGVSGWAIDNSGNSAFNNVNLRGQLNTGSFQGYAWPAAGGGSHISANGILAGNANTGKYFQITAGGDLYAPGFTIINGNASFYGGGNFSGNLVANTLSTNGGRFTAYSDGSVVADNVDIRRRIVLQTGQIGHSQVASGVNTYGDGAGGVTAVYDPPGSYINGDFVKVAAYTDIYDASAVSGSNNQPYYAVAYPVGPFQGSNPADTYGNYSIGYSAKAFASRETDRYGNYTDSYRIVLTFSYSIRINSGILGQFVLPVIQWIVYKL